MTGPDIPRRARLKLRSLRDCKVIRAVADDTGFDWLFQRGYATAHNFADPQPRLADYLDFRITADGEALAAMVLK